MTEQQWINVNERLPVAGVRVLVRTTKGEVVCAVLDLNLGSDQWTTRPGNWPVRVVRWMQIPDAQEVKP